MSSDPNLTIRSELTDHQQDFCRDTTLPVCNLYKQGLVKGGEGYNTGPTNQCNLMGISLGNDRYLRNLGVILLDGLAILVVVALLALTQRRKAAVGRKEIQLFLIGYFILSLCEIFTIGGFPLDSTIRIAFTGIHLGIITATCWMLMINGAVGYQAIDDGSLLSVSLLFLSTAALFIGTGYIALDTGYNWSSYWNGDGVQFNPDRQYSLYTLYLLAPLVFLFVYFWLAFFLVIRVLGEKKPLSMFDPTSQPAT